MADDWHTCPADIFNDERLEGANLSTITGYCVLVMLADDHGIFDASPRILGRHIGCSSNEIAALQAELVRRRLLRLYETHDGTRERQAGILLGFHGYRGHPERVAFPSKRGASVLPFPDGEKVLSRRQRGAETAVASANVEARRKKRGNGVAETWKPSAPAETKAAKPEHEQAWQERGSAVEAPSQDRGNATAQNRNRSARAPEQHSVAQRSTAGAAPHRAAPKPAPAAPTPRPHEPSVNAGGSSAPLGLGGPDGAAPMMPIGAGQDATDGGPAGPAAGPAVDPQNAQEGQSLPPRTQSEGGGSSPAWVGPPEGHQSAKTDGVRKDTPADPEPDHAMMPRLGPHPKAKPCPACREPVDPGEPCWACAHLRALAQAELARPHPPTLTLITGGDA